LTINVFLDADLDGNLDNNEQQSKAATVANVAIFVDANDDGQYTAFVDPVYYGPYPITLTLRKDYYSVGVVPGSMGNLVIGYTDKPGRTEWTVRLDPSTTQTIRIPLSENQPPVARSVSRVAFVGSTVTINNLITAGTDPNNNLDLNTAIVILDNPRYGSASVSRGTFTYVPNGRYKVNERIPYHICDTADACSQTAYINLQFVTRDGQGNDNGDDGQFISSYYYQGDNSASSVSMAFALVCFVVVLLL